MSQQRRRGPMGGHGMQPTEKAKDFKDSMKKLFGYMGRYKISFYPDVYLCSGRYSV